MNSNEDEIKDSEKIEETEKQEADEDSKETPEKEAKSSETELKADEDSKETPEKEAESSEASERSDETKTDTEKSEKKEENKELANQEKDSDNKLINHSDNKTSGTFLKNPIFLKRIVPAFVVLVFLILIVCCAVGVSNSNQSRKNDELVENENDEFSTEVEEFSADQLSIIIAKINAYNEELADKPTLVKYYTSRNEDGSEDELFYEDGYDTETGIIYTYSPTLDLELWSVTSNKDELNTMEYDESLDLNRRTVVYYDKDAGEMKKYVSDFDLDTESEITAIDSEDYTFSFSQDTRIVNGEECYMIQLVASDESEDDTDKIYLLVTRNGYNYVGTAIEHEEFFEYMLLGSDEDINNTVCKYTTSELHSMTPTTYDDYTTYVLSTIEVTND
jgi:hypothetical protein